MKTPKIILSLIFLLLGSSAFAQGFVMIVNSENPTLQISKDVIQDYYFKRNRSWSDGKPVRFFDRQNNGLRESFLKTIINKSSRQVDQYWIGQKFNTGDSAPTQVSSDSLVIGLVSKFPGGIGYVSEGTVLPKEVKVIEVMGK
jgi:ABC-type phosphate transport system substrate-binding protein